LDNQTQKPFVIGYFILCATIIGATTLLAVGNNLYQVIFSAVSVLSILSAMIWYTLNRFNKIQSDHNAEITQLKIKLKNSTIEQEKTQEIQYNTQQSIDQLDVCIIILDNEHRVTYLSDATQKLFQTIESAETETSVFSVSNLYQKKLSQLFPGQITHNDVMLGGEKEIHFHSRQIQFLISALKTDNEERSGTLVQLLDLTSDKVTSDVLSQQFLLQQQLAEQQSRIHHALELVGFCLIITDDHHNTIFINQAMHDLLTRLTPAIQQKSPGFNVDELTGKYPDFIPDGTFSTKEPEPSNLILSETILTLSRSNITSKKGQQLGHILIFNDATEEFQQEIIKYRKRYQERLIANENSKIHQALDNVSANVLLVNPRAEIVYANQASISLFSSFESQIQKLIPSFNANNLIGQSTSLFDSDQLSVKTITNLSSQNNIELQFAKQTLNLTITPVFNHEKRIGTVIEIQNLTHQQYIQQQIEKLISAAQRGDIHHRLEVQATDPVFGSLASGLNEFLDTVGLFFQDIARIFSRISASNLSLKINNNYQGTFGEVTEDGNKTIDYLATVVEQIITTSTQIYSSLQEIINSNQTLSEKTAHQQNFFNQISNEIDTLTKSIKLTKGNTNNADQLALQASSMAQEGGNIVNQTIDAVNEIQNSSSLINNISEIMNDIAFNLNLLALNALVEAAQAGKHGKGFSIVAAEVRSLASRTKESAEEISQLVADSSIKIKAGTKLANQAGETLTNIIDSISQVQNIISQINKQSEMQTENVDSFNRDLKKMHMLTQDISVLASKTDKDSVASFQFAYDLHKLAEVFTLPGQNATTTTTTAEDSDTDFLFDF
jgi:methyl-accepting chemotaxis protein